MEYCYESIDGTVRPIQNKTVLLHLKKKAGFIQGETFTVSNGNSDIILKTKKVELGKVIFNIVLKKVE
jgi:hypothetical protein